MALRSVVSSKMPIVIILGATGTGKTKLSLELAQKFNTELISADSMQIYKGLDVVTAKATVQERALVPHHLLDILEPHQCFTVVDFRNRALSLIDNMIQQEKLPIIVGGTNYYIESIVYKILVEDMEDTDSLLWDVSRRKRDFTDIADSESSASKKQVTKDITKEDSSTTKEPSESTSRVEAEEETKEAKDKEVEVVTRESLKEDVDNEKNFTSEEIHAKLKAIDPTMAKRLHPNNRRKILRSIEVWLKSGRRHSELLAAQKLSEGQLRRPGATVILWLKCEQSVHDKRLDARVDAMLEEGLIQELLDFHERHNRQRIRDGQ